MSSDRKEFMSEQSVLTRRELLFSRLAELAIDNRTYSHPPLHTVAESQAFRRDMPGAHCKNLFLKDKKDKLWLIVLLEDRQIALNQLPRHIGSARLSFGKPELLHQVLGVAPGSVTPFALINDLDRRVNLVLDKVILAHKTVNFHPLENTATTALSPDGLLEFIRSCGHDPLVLDFDALA